MTDPWDWLVHLPTFIYDKDEPKVGKYTSPIHGSYGIQLPILVVGNYLGVGTY